MSTEVATLLWNDDKPMVIYGSRTNMLSAQAISDKFEKREQRMSLF